MHRTRPGSGPTLQVSGEFAAFRTFDVERYGEPLYRLDGDELAGVRWADWSGDGRLLVATADGRLQVRDGRDGRTVRWETDVRGLAPDPRPAPPEAASW